MGICALAWANLPYLIGCLVQDSHHAYSGFFIFEQDGFSYLAKMRQGAQGNWLFTLPYTTEPHQGAFVYVFYLVAGKLSRFIGLSNLAFYHILRLLGSALLLVIGGEFVCHFASTRRWRLASWGLILFGGGIDWLLSMFSPRYVSYASVAPDAFVYSVLFGPPHVVTALAFLLWTLLKVSDLFRRGGQPSRPRILLSAALGGIGVALCRPEYVPILLSVSGAYWLALCCQARRLYLAELFFAAAAILPALAYAVYVLFILRTNPAIAAWATQNPFESPSLPNLLAGVGVLLFPAVLGLTGRPASPSAPQRGWWQDPDRLLLTSWLLVLPFLLYFPLSLSRRLIGGAQFTMGIMGGFWIDRHLVPWLSTGSWRRAIAAPLLALATVLLASYPLLFGLGSAMFVSSHPNSLFLSADESAALQWLANQGGRPVVLADETTGNHIPAFTNGVPVLGHPIETLAIEEKRADVSRFYRADTDPDERAVILHKYKVTLVWWGDAERKLGDFSPSDGLSLERVFTSNSIEIWRQLSPPG